MTTSWANTPVMGGYWSCHTLLFMYATDGTDHTGALGESLTEAILSHDVIAVLHVYGCY